MGTSMTWGLLDLLVMALATLRLAYMISVETGPWRMFYWLRTRVPLGGLTACIYCTSVWLALIVGIVYIVQPIIVWPFAVSGAALVVRAYTGFGMRNGDG